MRNFFKSGRFKGFLGIFAVLLAGIVFAAASQSRATPVSSALSTVFAPFQRAATAVARAADGFSLKFRSSTKYLEEIKQLNEELAAYREQLADFEKTKQKLSTYEEFLEIKEENHDYKFVPATIIGRDESDHFGTFTVNMGDLDGVKVNNPVIFGKNLVGVIVRTGPVSSVVKTLLNPEMYVSASEIRTRESGFVTTTAELASVGQCRLSGLERITSVSPGGIVCTTGTGGIYPPDLIIGTVEEVKNDETNISSYAVIDPQINFGDLNDVFIITDFRGMNTKG